MIKNFFDKLMGKPAKAKAPSLQAPNPAIAPEPVKSAFGQRREYGFAEHQINVKLVDERAMDTVRTLKNAGFEAFIVGGAVRDLLVGLVPKDFDVATNATPEEVKVLFRRAFIIGRRFRIVHVIYGRGQEHEVIEVSTFRAHLDNALAEQVGGNERTSKSALAGMKHAVDSAGRVLRDNVWGSMEHDAARRDFTINAMYYDPQTQTVVDWHGGMEDSKHKTIRMIGDPAARYREDPVRIIRAVRFSAKLAALGFGFAPETSAPLARMKGLLADVPQSRLFDEMLKLLQTGHSIASIAQLKSLGLATGIYPLLDVVVAREAEPFLNLALLDTDRRVAEGKPVAPSFLIAALLWADVRTGWQLRLADGYHSLPALHEAIDDAFNARIGDVSGRGKLGIDVREIWGMQPRFDKRSGSAPYSLIEQPRFRAGMDFLRLRAQCGEASIELAEWWEKFSTGYDDERHAMVETLRLAAQPARKANRVVKVPAAAPSVSGTEISDSPQLVEAGGVTGFTDAGHADLADTAFSATIPARRKRVRRKAVASVSTSEDTPANLDLHPADSSGPTAEQMDIAFGLATDSPASASASASASGFETEEAISSQPEAAPKKRRRRNKNPGGGSIDNHSADNQNGNSDGTQVASNESPATTNADLKPVGVRLPDAHS